MGIRHAKDDEPLLNGRQLGRSIGRGATYITAAKAAGYQFLYGTQTTRRHFLEWRAANPHFRVTQYVKEHSGKKPGHGSPLHGLLASIVGKSGEPA
jgi:hypothetical protein